jgi:adenylyltransferase/sulfurtransferase
MNDYEAFCGSPACDKTSSKNILERDRRITCQKYEEMRRNGVPHVLLDVRPQVQFDICSLPNALPVPLEEMEDKANVIREAKEKVQIQTGANDVAGNLFF